MLHIQNQDIVYTGTTSDKEECQSYSIRNG